VPVKLFRSHSLHTTQRVSPRAPTRSAIAPERWRRTKTRGP
jgi:hypothetical protein